MSSVSQTDIAVVGMACRLPGAATPEQFWRNLANGVESVRFFSEAELLAAGVEPAMLARPDYVRAGVVLEDLEMFDAGFFGLSPKEAAIMDPQHRHFLECAWEALESSGHMPESFPGSIGVFAGCGMNAYMMYNLITNRQLMDSTGLFLVRHTGNDKDFLATRVSYQFDLRGPSISVQTACSTSLVAIHLAVQSLLSGECDMALAGGVTIELPHRQGYLYQEGEILSRDGHCRSFDRDSTGTIFGSGAGIVVLRRLADALEDGDTIYAVIKGSAINNDGSSKVGYLAPSVEGQAKAISEALAVGGVDADTVTYVETHGTGTAVGDPIEITALTEAFRRTTNRKGYCAIGSVKSNIGHLDTAAGVASFIKTVLALRHRQIPPSLHFRNPNPLIDFANSPFFVNTALRPWESNGPRRAGVSSLGVGGTNAHVVLEEAPQLEAQPSQRAWHILPLSARSPEALEALSERYREHCATLNAAEFADAAYTAQMGRRRFRHRRVVVARDGQDAAAALVSRDPKRVSTAAGQDATPSVVFLFPGGGAQHPNMGRGLYEQEPVFRAHVDECLALVAPHLDFDLKSLMFPAEADAEAAAAQLRRPLQSILSIFIVEYALARLWMSWGIVPKAVTGHSLGEYTAACIAGVLSLEDALSLVLARGRVFERMPEGAMLSVALPEAELAPLLGAKLTIAAVNGPDSCVASGEVAAIEALELELKRREIECARVHISVAAHSPMLEPFLEEFAAHAARIPLRAPSLPCISNLTGTWMRPEDLDARYWVRHLRGTVRFSAGLAELFREPHSVFLEVGPGTTLSGLAMAHPDRGDTHTVISSMRHPKDTGSDQQFQMMALGRLWLAGVAVDWSKLWEGETRRRVSLPTYAFEHKPYWIEPGKVDYAAAPPAALAAPEPPPITKLDSMDAWFWQKSWKAATLPAPTASRQEHWLIFKDRFGLGDTLAEILKQRGQLVTSVSEGADFVAVSEAEYSIPAGGARLTSLLAALIENGRTPHRIVYLWPYGPANHTAERHVDINLWTPLALVQVLAGEDLVNALDLTLVSSGAQVCGAQERAEHPERALLAGPAKVIPQEYPGVAARWVDIPYPPSKAELRRFAEMLLEEAQAQSQDSTVALRADQRLKESWEPAPLAGQLDGALRERGTYVITGGLGGMALAFAEHLIGRYQASVTLIHRSEFPRREEWQTWLTTRPQSRTASRVRKLMALESLGGEIRLRRADVTDAAQLRRIFSELRAERGTIDGVIHTAGVMKDGIIQEKTRDQVLEVVSPKLLGVMALDSLLDEFAPGFLLLCSSTSALLGLPGQSDYTAANAFLDAYAQARSASGSKTRVVSINWGVWSDTGMAVNALAGVVDGELDVVAPAGESPLPGAAARSSDRRVLSSASYSPATHWVLAEHKLKGGPAILPGTAYVDLAIAAARNGSKPVAIQDLILVAPMVFDGTDSRQLLVRATPGSDGAALTISSASTGRTAPVTDHAQGTIAADAIGRRAPADLAAIRARCSQRTVAVHQGDPVSRQGEILDFGPRWANLRNVYLGQNELLAELRLADEFAADLKDHPAHPALLDMAAGCGLALVDGVLQDSGLWVPLSWGRIVFYHPLAQEIRSHVRLRRREAGHHPTAVFDVTIFDTQGNVLLEMESFTMRRIAPEDLRAGARPGSGAAKGKSPLLESLVAAGISASEGVAVLERALGQQGLPQLAASSIHLESLVALFKPKPVRQAAPAPAASGGDEIETYLCQLWSELLGAPSIGLDDDFFDLGGHSLIAVRLFNKIKKAYKTDLGLATLFEARTVRQLAAVLRKAPKSGGGASGGRCLVPLRKEGAKPILFCVHGVGGNVLGYHELVKRLPADQPFYAIQSASLVQPGPPLTDLRKMAEIYVREVRELQPEGPYYLCGYSFGGVAAYEMAQQLHAAGQRVAFLGIFDSDRPDASLDLASRIWLNIQHLWRLEGGKRKQYLARKLRALASRVRRSGVKVPPPPPPSSSRPEVRQANFQAYLSYRTLPYPGHMVLFRTTELGDSGFRKPNLGWTGMALGGLDVRLVPGNHITVLYEPNVSVLAQKLAECLEETYHREGLASGPSPDPAAAAAGPAEMALLR